MMESTDTESSWSVYSDCDCYRCQYGISQGQELEPFPFYPSIQQPFVYFAQCRHGYVRKKDCKVCRPNCFVRAFRWYTNEHGDKRSKPCEPPPCNDPTPNKGPCIDPCNNEVCELYEEPGYKDPGQQNLSSFALWLDSKYHEFLTENTDACRVQVTETEVLNNCNAPQSGKRMTTKNWKYKVQKCQNAGQNDYARNNQDCGKNNTSMEFIMTPKNLSHAASECCHPTPTCSTDVRHIVRSRSATATVCKSGYGNQEFVKTEPCKTNRNISCQVKHIGHNAQTQYETSQSCNTTCPITARCPPRTTTSTQPTPQSQVSQSKKSSVESHIAQKRKSTETRSNHSNIKCECSHHHKENKTTKGKKEEKEEAETNDSKQQFDAQQPQFNSQQPVPAVQPYPNSQQPCPDFQKPCPSLQQQTNLPFPCPSVNEPCPGLRPCPTLRATCGTCENSNTPMSTTEQREQVLQFQPASPSSYVQQREQVSQFQSTPQAPYIQEREQVSQFQSPPQAPYIQQPEQVSQFQSTPQAPYVQQREQVSQFQSVPQAPYVHQREQVSQFQSVPQAPYWEANAGVQNQLPDVQNQHQDIQKPFNKQRTQKPCPDFQKPCPSLDPTTNLLEPCPGLHEPCPGRKPCPSFREPCPPCPKSNTCSTNVQQQQVPNLNINSQNQYQPYAMQREPYSEFQTNYEQQTKYDSQVRYQQGTIQQPPQMRYESQTRYQQPIQSSQNSRFDSQTRYQQPGPFQQSPDAIFEPRIPYQQPSGPIQQGSQMRYSEKNLEMQYYDYKSNHNTCCRNSSSIRREQGPTFIREMPPKPDETYAANVGFQEQYRTPGQTYREAGYSGGETYPGPCKTCSNLIHGACDVTSNRCEASPECNCLNCSAYGNSRCCKRMQTFGPPPVKNVIITTAAVEGKCSANCPYYSSNKGETTQTVQFSTTSRDTTSQTSSTAIQLERSTNPDYKLFMRVVCADKP